MQVNYTGRHTKVTDEMKEYMEKKLKKIKFYFDQIMNVDLVVEEQKGQLTFELKVSANGDFFIAKETSFNWTEGIDGVTDKIENSIKKKRDKITEHH